MRTIFCYLFIYFCCIWVFFLIYVVVQLVTAPVLKRSVYCVYVVPKTILIYVLFVSSFSSCLQPETVTPNGLLVLSPTPLWLMNCGRFLSPQKASPLRPALLPASPARSRHPRPGTIAPSGWQAGLVLNRDSLLVSIWAVCERETPESAILSIRLFGHCIIQM